jgi:hypothetical protein
MVRFVRDVVRGRKPMRDSVLLVVLYWMPPGLFPIDFTAEAAESAEELRVICYSCSCQRLNQQMTASSSALSAASAVKTTNHS